LERKAPASKEVDEETEDFHSVKPSSNQQDGSDADSMRGGDSGAVPAVTTLGQHSAVTIVFSKTDRFAEGKDLKIATEELRPFLVSARNKLQRFLNPNGTLKNNSLTEVHEPEIGSLLLKQRSDENQEQELRDTARLVDTTLFRAYMFSSPSLAGPLFRIDNFCDPDVVKEKLEETGRYNDLLDFFHGKHLHRQALELLQKFGHDKGENESARQLNGPQRTVAYLQNLQSEMIDLILEFATWPLKEDPELGMEVFLVDTENAETLPRGKVLNFLEQIDKKLAIRYLEHIIHELDDKTPDFHQRLVKSYIERLEEDQFESEEERKLWKEKTLEFLRTSSNYQAYKALGHLSNDGTCILLQPPKHRFLPLIRRI